MRIGMVGCGKLGYPCAVAMQMKGHDVMGFDVNSGVMNNNPRRYLETGPNGKEEFNSYAEKYPIDFGDLEHIVDHSEIIFIAVQTPHEREYEGITRIPDTRKDFDYSHLRSSIIQLSNVVKEKKTKSVVVVVISTVLPGTFRKHILPFASNRMKMCYNPFFIAMGTTMRDFLNPEFVLFGVHDKQAGALAEELYSTLVSAPFYQTGVENAELIKVGYNTYIGMKIAFANTLMEICHKIPGTNVDEVTHALSLSNERLISSRYFTGGMGDGGGCHPRDNIALSWLSDELGLRHNWFDGIMMQRENGTEFLADIVEQNCQDYNLGVTMLGYSFKENTNITTGSPARLLEKLLAERKIFVIKFDPFVSPDRSIDGLLVGPSVFFIGTRHDVFKEVKFPVGSVVIDPWRYLNLNQDGVKYIPVGVGK